MEPKGKQAEDQDPDRFRRHDGSDEPPIRLHIGRRHRTVSVKGSGGVSATVIVIVQQGQVSMSLQPPFVWEAIMDPGKVQELIRTLRLAGEDAEKIKRGRSVSQTRRG